MPVDLQPFTRLHSFSVLRDLIRKWWKLEVFLADSQGEPVAQAPPPGSAAPPRPPEPGEPVPIVPVRPIPRDNDFCRLALHSPLGSRRCAESLRVTLERLRGAGRAERCVVHECHLGFDVMACALWLGGELAGFVAASGFVHDAWSSFGENQLLRKMHETVPAAGRGTDLERALRRVPYLSRVETEQLGDLLELMAEELRAYHDSRGRQEAPP